MGSAGAFRPVRESDDPARHPGYRVSGHGPFDRVSVGPLALDAGGELPKAELGIVTVGELNARRDNAVLLTTWYSGSHLAYLRNYVGPGRALDPNASFIVIVNQLGNGFSTSATDPGAAGPLPDVSIVDDVVAQERLVREVFGIERLALVLGCSMGAMQAYEWGARFPDSVARIAAIAGTAAPTAAVHNLIAAIQHALTGDRRSDPTAALQRHADLWKLFGYSPSFWNDGGWTELGFSSVGKFLATTFEPLMASRSVDVLTSLAGKWSRAGRYSDGQTIPLERITAQTIVVPISNDGIFPIEDCERDSARIPGSRLATIESRIGHLDVQGLSPSYQSAFDRVIGDWLRE